MAAELLAACEGLMDWNDTFFNKMQTGEERWRFDPGIDKDAYLLPNCRGVSSWRSGAAGFCCWSTASA